MFSERNQSDLPHSDILKSNMQNKMLEEAFVLLKNSGIVEILDCLNFNGHD